MPSRGVEPPNAGARPSSAAPEPSTATDARTGQLRNARTSWRTCATPLLLEPLLEIRRGFALTFLTRCPVVVDGSERPLDFGHGYRRKGGRLTLKEHGDEHKRPMPRHCSRARRSCLPRRSATIFRRKTKAEDLDPDRLGHGFPRLAS